MVGDRRRGKQGKNRCGRQLCGGPPLRRRRNPIAGNTDTAWFAADVFERPARGPPLHGAQTSRGGHLRMRSRRYRLFVSCVCVYVRACAVLIECDANIRNNIIIFLCRYKLYYRLSLITRKIFDFIALVNLCYTVRFSHPYYYLLDLRSTTIYIRLS